MVHDVTIEYIDLHADSTNFILTNDGDSFGHVTFNDTNSNAPIDFTLVSSNPSASGMLTFINNKIVMDESTAYNPNITFSTNNLAGLAVIAAGSNQSLTVDSFFNNEITNINSNENVSTYAFYAESQSTRAIVFTNGMKKNDLLVNSTESNVPPSTTQTVAFYNHHVILRDDFSFNELTALGSIAEGSPFNESGVLGFVTDADFTLANNASMFRNTIIAKNEGLDIAWFQPVGTSIIITGDFRDNDLSVSTGGDASFNSDAWESAGDVVINGDFSGNTLTATNVDFGTALELTGGSNWLIKGDFINNQLITTDAKGSLDFGRVLTIEEGKLVIEGDFTGNTLSTSDSYAEAYALEIMFNGELTVGGDFSDNTLSSLRCADDDGAGIYIEDNSSLTINGNFTGNTITVSDAADYGYGLYVDADSTINVQGTFTDNTFILSDNHDTNFAFDIEGNAFFSPTQHVFQGVLSNNTITITDTIGVPNIGFNVDIDYSTVTFEKAVVDNAITIDTTSGNSNDSYGFYLNASTSSGGTINFEGNSSATQLASSNNTTVQVDPSANNVNFG
jgi:hypothetical protein